MTEMNFDFPPALEAWVEARLAEGRYADLADYIRDLVRRDQEEMLEDAAWVRAMIEEGDASGFLDAEPEDVLRKIMAQRLDG